MPQPFWTRAILLTLLLALVTALAFQGSRRLWGPDEGRYSNIALQMVESGDWVTPRRHPQHTHFAKPPLVYWAIAASVSVLGKSEFALRLPGALSLFASVLLLVLLGRRLTPGAPWLPGLIFTTSLVPFAAGNWINTDYLLTVFETLAVLGFVILWQAGDARTAGRGRALMWAGFALAFLTKGPPGLLPLLPIVVFLRLQPRPWPRLVSSTGLALFLLIALPWYLTVIRMHPGLLAYFLGEEVYGRVFTDMHDRSGGTFGAVKVFGPMLLVGLLPWAVVIWRRLPAAWRMRRQPRLWWRSLDTIDQFLLLWCVLPFCVFVLATSKLPLYLLPLLVPAALLVARRLLPLDAARLRRIQLTAGVSALLLVLIKGAVPMLVPHAKDAFELSQLVRAQFTPLPEEIVFIDESAQYGLRFYLDIPVERVALTARDDFDFDSSLAAEIAEDERRAWITTRNRIPRTNQALAALGYRFVEKAELERYVLGSVEPL